MNIRVSLPYFNDADMLAVQFKAFAVQTWTGNWEGMISNHGYTDRSVEIAASDRNQFPPL